MKAISKVVVAGLFSMALFSGTAQACNHRCQAYPNVRVAPQNIPQSVPQLNNIPQPIPNPPTVGNGLSQNDTVINDLPVDAKRAIKAAAAKARSSGQVRQFSNSSTGTRR